MSAQNRAARHRRHRPLEDAPLHILWWSVFAHRFDKQRWTLPPSLKGGLQIEVLSEKDPPCAYYLLLDGAKSFAAPGTGPSLAKLHLKERDIEALLKNEPHVAPRIVGDRDFVHQVFAALSAQTQARSMLSVRCSS